MSKFFNNNNNATVNQSQETEQHQSSKLGWLKTGLMVVGGTAAAVGAAIGARKLYEKFSDLDGKLESADYDDDDCDDGSGMEDLESSNETDTSTNPETDFMEVEPESISYDSVFVSAEELADTKSTSSVPKPELDENGNFILPKGKSWNDLVREELMSNFKDLESYFMSVSDADMGDPIWVIRSSVSIFNKAASIAGKTAWEDAYIESMREDLDAYLMRYIRGLENRFADTHRMGDLIYVRRLYDEYLASPFYAYPLGKEMRDILENIESELQKYKAQKYKALKHSPAPEKDELDKELESSNNSKEESEVDTAPDSSVALTPAEDDAAKAETAASSENALDEPENPEVIDQFKKDMNFLGGLMKSGKYAESQKFFRENLSTYLTDPNVSEEIRSALEQVQHQITNFLIAEKQAAAIEEANNCSRRTNKKKGGKRNYKKNGRR